MIMGINIRKLGKHYEIEMRFALYSIVLNGTELEREYSLKTLENNGSGMTTLSKNEVTEMYKRYLIYKTIYEKDHK